MKRYFYTLAILTLGVISVNAQEFDDIYYNPKKDNSSSVKEKKKVKESNYIQDFSSIDVDEYNRRGQYYESPIDTIGARAETGEDFVYTQKIQKFYNPTIVVDNMGVLDDVLVNSYGNIDIIFENGLPYFNSIYGWPGYYNYYSWMPSWRWGGIGSWYYSPVWGYEWWPSWSLGPSWAWGPTYGWGWGYGPSWSWGPAYGWGWGWGPSMTWGRPYYADYTPWGRQPNRPGSNWANNTRPGGNAGRPAGNRPGYSAVNGSNKNPSNTNYHRTYSFGNNGTASRVNGMGSSSSRGSYSVGSDGHRRYGTSSGNSSTVNRGSSTSNRSTNSYNSNSGSSSRGSSSSSYNRGGSYGGSRSTTGGSYGGGRSSGGSGRGRR